MTVVFKTWIHLFLHVYGLLRKRIKWINVIGKILGSIGFHDIVAMVLHLALASCAV